MKPVFIVAFADEEGPYAVAFSTRKDAETYAANIDGEDVKVFETHIDEHLDLIRDIYETTGDDA